MKWKIYLLFTGKAIIPLSTDIVQYCNGTPIPLANVVSLILSLSISHTSSFQTVGRDPPVGYDPIFGGSRASATQKLQSIVGHNTLSKVNYMPVLTRSYRAFQGALWVMRRHHPEATKHLQLLCSPPSNSVQKVTVFWKYSLSFAPADPESPCQATSLTRRLLILRRLLGHCRTE